MRYVLTIALFTAAVASSLSGTDDRQRAPKQQDVQNQPAATSPSSPVTVIVNQAPAPTEQKHVAVTQEHNWNFGLWPPIWSNWVLILVASVAAYFAFDNLSEIRKQSEATDKSATAANNNAVAVINAERAWVMVEIEWQPGAGKLIYGSGDGGEMIHLNVVCLCKNEGKTPAWITEKWASVRLVNTIPQQPDFSDRDKIFQHAVQPMPAGMRDPDYRLWLSCPGNHEQRLSKALLLYGYVKYRTIFGKEGETRFGYMITASDVFERLPITNPEYNKTT